MSFRRHLRAVEDLLVGPPENWCGVCGDGDDAVVGAEIAYDRAELRGLVSHENVYTAPATQEPAAG